MDHTIKHRAASGTRQPSATTDHVAKELNRYDDHLRDVRGLAAGTRKHCTRIVGRLLHQKFAKRLSKLPSSVRVTCSNFWPANLMRARRLPTHRNWRRHCEVICVTEAPAVTRSAHCLQSYRIRCTGTWRHCHALLRRTKRNACWHPFQPPAVGRNAATPSCAVRWTWDCVPVRSPTSRSTTSTGAPARSR